VKTAVPLLASVLFVIGCGLPLGSEPVPTSNRCSDDSDCGADGICLVEQSLCVSRQAELDELRVEVFVPSGSADEAGTSSLVNLPALRDEDPNGLVVQRDLITLPFATVTGRLRVSDSSCTSLERQDGFFPITLELRPADTPTGLSLPSFGQTSSSIAGELGVRVPEGRYDITVRPDTSQSMVTEASDACVLPPALFTNEIVRGSFDIDLGLDNPPVLLDGEVRGQNVTGWTVDLIDREQGRALSDVVTLGEGEPIDSILTTPYSLRYWQEVVATENSGAFLRLRPPKSLQSGGFPTILNELTSGSTFDLTKLQSATTIPVQANVVDGNDGLSARVVIQSVRFLDGEMGNTVYYKQEVRTDGDGVLEVTLFTGTYRFTAIPDNPSFASTEVTVELGKNDLGGKTLVLQPKIPLRGNVRTASGEPAFGLAVSLSTATSAPQSFVSSRLNPLAISNLNAEDVTSPDGGYAFEVPPDQYDLSVRPPSDSGLPWAVLSRLAIDKSTPALDLTLSNPVLLFGRVLSGDDGNAIPGAVIRVWAPRTSPEGETADAVFQIAEATANGDGEYQLVLPSSLNDALAGPP